MLLQNLNVTTKAQKNYKQFKYLNYSVSFLKFLEPVKQLIEDHDVDVIAYPTAWVDELPFLTGNFQHKGPSINA